MMYKPPQNNNRVRSLKNKFENLEKINSEKVQNNVCGNNMIRFTKTETLKEIPTLQRQTSDPLKMNIKRTPAFRVDKSVAENCGSQMQCFDKSGMLESKLRLYTTIKNNCDNISNICEKNNNSSDEGTELTSDSSVRNLMKCKNFQYSHKNCKGQIVKNNVFQQNCVPCESDTVIDGNMANLYTEPIPKALRNNSMHNNVPKKETDIDIHNSIGKVSQNNENVNISQHLLTDTLKIALKKPLPVGPAPRKPPRTFQHIQKKTDLKKNISLVSSIIDNKREFNLGTNHRKTDAKYMLNKLENALKNNKLHVKKHRIDISTTSGEDSDENILCKSDYDRARHKGGCCQNEDSVYSTFNFNCLSLMNCSKSKCGIMHQPIYNESDHLLKNCPSIIKKDRKSV